MRPSLVIPTLNAGPLFGEVLAAIDAQEGIEDLEKVAVDSGSTDATVDQLRAHGFAVHGIERRDFQHGASRDLAISKTSGDVVLLLTQDATPEPGWLSALGVVFAEHPEVEAAWCHQQPRPGCNPILAQRIAGWMGDRANRTFQQLAPGKVLEDLAPMDQLMLCAFDNVASAVRRPVWERYRFGPRRFGEDVAFGRKVIAEGGTIAFVPKSRVVHSHDTTPLQEGLRIYRDHQNLAELFGLVVLPDLGSCRRAARAGAEHFVQQVHALPDLPADERRSLAEWARDYGRWTTWAQYLGANSKRLRRSPLAPVIWWWERRA